METNDVLKVYHTLKKIMLEIPEDDVRKVGFREALYLLRRGLKTCPQANHIMQFRIYERQIKKLSHEIRWRDVKISDLEEDYAVIERRLENSLLILKDRGLTGSYNDTYRPVDVEVNGYNVYFGCEISFEDFERHFESAARYALDGKIKKHPQSTLKNRMMEYFRNNGFKCKTICKPTLTDSATELLPSA